LAKTYLAIDPGRTRCGLVLISEEGKVLEQAVLPTKELVEELKRLYLNYQPEKILLGKGTFSRNLRDKIKKQLNGVNLELRDEKYSTEQAKKRYFVDHPPRGLKKLIPAGMLLPDRPFDDYAALILAEKYLKEQKQEKCKIQQLTLFEEG